VKSFVFLIEEVLCIVVKDLGHTGPNPTTSIYNASVEKNYNGTNNLSHFYNKNTLAYYNAGVVAVISKS
jgi:hypothetical protein